ncbi:IS1 family transposase, partial [Shigella sonnei]|uniref:IS1 family transposase n=1 Tax=Shigella sonnei TaxID=624 RepID=UPI00338E209D
MASVSISCPSCSATDGVVRNGKRTAARQRAIRSTSCTTWTFQLPSTATQPTTNQKNHAMARNSLGR